MENLQVRSVLTEKTSKQNTDIRAFNKYVVLAKFVDKHADYFQDEILKSEGWFGQFGQIAKLELKNSCFRKKNRFVIIQYERPFSASMAILSMPNDNKLQVKLKFGIEKFCKSLEVGKGCEKKNCKFRHEKVNNKTDLVYMDTNDKVDLTHLSNMAALKFALEYWDDVQKTYPYYGQNVFMPLDYNNKEMILNKCLKSNLIDEHACKYIIDKLKTITDQLDDNITNGTHPPNCFHNDALSVTLSQPQNSMMNHQSQQQQASVHYLNINNSTYSNYNEFGDNMQQTYNQNNNQQYSSQPYQKNNSHTYDGQYKSCGWEENGSNTSNINNNKNYYNEPNYFLNNQDYRQGFANNQQIYGNGNQNQENPDSYNRGNCNVQQSHGYQNQGHNQNYHRHQSLKGQQSYQGQQVYPGQLHNAKLRNHISPYKSFNGHQASSYNDQINSHSNNNEFHQNTNHSHLQSFNSYQSFSQISRSPYQSYNGQQLEPPSLNNNTNDYYNQKYQEPPQYSLNDKNKNYFLSQQNFNNQDQKITNQANSPDNISKKLDSKDSLQPKLKSDEADPIPTEADPTPNEIIATPDRIDTLMKGLNFLNSPIKEKSESNHTETLQVSSSRKSQTNKTETEQLKQPSSSSAQEEATLVQPHIKSDKTFHRFLLEADRGNRQEVGQLVMNSQNDTDSSPYNTFITRERIDVFPSLKKYDALVINNLDHKNTFLSDVSL